MRSSLRLALAACAVAALAITATALATILSNPAPIAIPASGSSGTANPYPSTISVSGLGGTITKVTATLNGFSHTFTDDVGVLLVGPTGTKAEIMDGAGDDPDVVGLTLTFDDEAASTLPCEAALSTGPYKPTDCYPGDADAYPAPAPAGPHDELLSAFNGTIPNGTWSLYVMDFLNGDTGSISGGWSLDITMNPTSVQASGFAARPARQGVELRWRTRSEAEVLGFDVYRQAGGTWLRLNRSLIAARGDAAAGASYRFADRSARPGSTYGYRLEVVRRDGSRWSAGLTYIAR